MNTLGFLQVGMVASISFHSLRGFLKDSCILSFNLSLLLPFSFSRWLDSDTSRTSLGSKVLPSEFSPALPKMIDYAGPAGCPAIPNK